MKSQQKINNQVPEIQDKWSRVSTKPGVYLMKDASNKVIYVGKARNLKKRMASYFSRSQDRSNHLDMKTGILVKKITDFETIITASEKEALILESNLIKRYRPKYNVMLKDDKRYPSLRLDITTPHPNLTMVRKTEKDGAFYFGPFSSSAAVQKTLKIIHKTFKLRKCKTKDFKSRSRPCINYQMDACLAPCCLNVSRETYQGIVKEVILFLKGRTPELIGKIKKEMKAAAKVHDYERAAVLRDKVFALEKTLEKQVAITTDFKDRDVVGIARSHDFLLIVLLVIRGGFILGRRNFNFAETLSTNSEIIGAFIRQFYEKSPFVPKEILVPDYLEDMSFIVELLADIKAQKVNIIHPKRGEKLCLVQMACQNAENSLKELRASVEAEKDILVRLQKCLRMEKIPRRIECFDVSSISGTATVAGMVVFEDGKPKKALYRKYKLKTSAIQDDYACMHEVLKRRYGRDNASKFYPDIMMVDGGKGQLNIAVSVIKALNLEHKFQIISIAKKNENRGETRDKIYRPGQANPVNLARNGDILLFLEKIRNESHRFAISFHRKRRGKAFMSSVLDSIPGVGKKRKATLLRHFKSIKKIRVATVEELMRLPGLNRRVADEIKRVLN